MLRSLPFSSVLRYKWAQTLPWWAFRHRGWFWKLHLISCDLCCIYSWSSSTLAGATLLVFQFFDISRNIKNFVFIARRQIFIKIYNHDKLRLFSPKKVKLVKCQIKVFSPGWRGSVDWAVGFGSGWVHVPGVWARTSVGVVQEEPFNVSLSHRCFCSLSFSLPSPLSKNKF